MACPLLNWGKDLPELAVLFPNQLSWHLDIMDGSFVPEIYGSRSMISDLKKTGLPVQVHLMVSHLERHIPKFLIEKPETLIIHIEQEPHIYRHLSSIQEAGIRSGVALNPGTPWQNLIPVLPVIDDILIMTVNPGWGGQKFLPSQIKKIEALHAYLESISQPKNILVDGGITPHHIQFFKKKQVHSFIVGSFIWDQNKTNHITERVKELLYINH
jgi:ribulose-phosphate 3-epimerase